jgi:hypothetical protein
MTHKPESGWGLDSSGMEGNMGGILTNMYQTPSVPLHNTNKINILPKKKLHFISSKLDHSKMTDIHF